jgi:hypothetical protein
MAGPRRLRISQAVLRDPQQISGFLSGYQQLEGGICSALSPARKKEIVMNTKAIIASLVLASSSVAMADPGVTLSASVHGSYGTPVVRDHRVGNGDTRYESPPIMRTGGWSGGGAWDGGRPLPPVYRPVTLGAGLSFANDGRKFITVGSQAGRFETLQINAAGGRTFIKQVYVQFDDGQEQVVRNLDRTLTGNASLTLDLDGNRRAIRRVVVYGNAINTGIHRSPGAFSVIAS